MPQNVALAVGVPGPARPSSLQAAGNAALVPMPAAPAASQQGAAVARVPWSSHGAQAQGRLASGLPGEGSLASCAGADSVSANQAALCVASIVQAPQTRLAQDRRQSGSLGPWPMPVASGHCARGLASHGQCYGGAGRSVLRCSTRSGVQSHWQGQAGSPSWARACCHRRLAILGVSQDMASSVGLLGQTLPLLPLPQSTCMAASVPARGPVAANTNPVFSLLSTPHHVWLHTARWAPSGSPQGTF